MAEDKSPVDWPELGESDALNGTDQALMNVAGNPRLVPLSRLRQYSIAAALEPREWEEDIEVTIAADGEAQEAVGANPNRTILMLVAHPDNNEPVFYHFGEGDATIDGSPEINVGFPYDSKFPLSPDDLLRVSVIAATAGTKVIVRQKVIS